VTHARWKYRTELVVDPVAFGEAALGGAAVVAVDA